MRNRWFLILLGFVSSCIFAFSATEVDRSLKDVAREGEEHELTVTLKLVQVYVSDKKGNPVVDLESEDFELYDKGKLQTITDFEKHVLTVPVIQMLGEETKKVEIEKEPPSAEAPKLTRKYYLFFDFAFNTSRGILDSKKAALHFIDESIQPTDEVGLLSFSAGEGLVPTADLLPGRYYLYLFAEDQDTHRRANVNTIFVVG